jgi:hypothetical protein
LRAEPTQRHNDVYEVREIFLNGLRALTAFVTCHSTQSCISESYSIRLNTREADMGLEVWREITTEYNGRTIKGSFKFIDGMVDVRTPHGSKATQSGGHTPEQTAQKLLRELAREGRA